MRRPDGATIELLQFQSPGLILGSKPNPMNSPGFTHLSYYVDDLDAAMDWLEANGGKALRHVEAFFNTPGMRAAFCTDPDGVRIELMQLTAQ
jgi:lactoylglutathione lyase